jgi:hypothetical protein
MHTKKEKRKTKHEKMRAISYILDSLWGIVPLLAVVLIVE